jgi:hypothetical protein
MKKINKQNKKYKVDFKKIRRNILFLFIIFSVFSILNSFDMGKKQVSTKQLLIQSEDTIWNIADNICTDNNDKNLNLQNVIIEIKDINNLSNSEIYEGQTLNIPVY